MDLGDTTAYLSKFRVFNPKSLFPPNFENLQKGLCPVCNRKLKFPRIKKIVICTSKANDKFVIGLQRYLSLGGKMPI